MNELYNSVMDRIFNDLDYLQRNNLIIEYKTIENENTINIYIKPNKTIEYIPIKLEINEDEYNHY